MFYLEVFPEWFEYKETKPEVTVFVRGNSPERISASVESLGAQETDRSYEVVVVTTSPEVVDMLEDARNPIVRWCVGDEKGYYTARGRLICELPEGFKASPKMIEALSVVDDVEDGMAFGRVKYPSGRRKSTKVCMVKGKGKERIFVDEVVAYAFGYGLQ